MSKIINGDAIIEMKKFPDNFFDSIVTDPPAGISFMNKSWDSDKGGRDAWIKWLAEVFTEAKRVLKPGGHALVWSLPRTSHWTGMALEQAGFECRDKIFDLLSANNVYNDFMLSLNSEQQKMWGLILESLSPSAIEHVFGSGFPKSMDISKAIDKQFGAEREIIGIKQGHEEFANRTTKGHIDFKNGTEGFDRPWMHNDESREKYHQLTAPSTSEAKQWSGWGTALKPAVECWWLVRKPLLEKTVAENVLKWGTGGINIDGCRIPIVAGIDDSQLRTMNRNKKENQEGWGMNKNMGDIPEVISNKGRFPSHLIHDGSEEILEEFAKAGNNKGAFAPVKRGQDGKSNGIYSDFAEKGDDGATYYNDTGTASRFFYCAKPSRSERDRELEGMSTKEIANNTGNNHFIAPLGRETAYRNNHPTVKAQALMEYLIKLITPPKGHILDMFGGSGSTGVAANSLGFESTLIEIDPEYCKIASLRTKNMEYKEITSKGKIGTFDDKDIEELKKEYGKKKRKSLFE